MQYKGKLYGKIGRNMYFDTGKTSDDWDELEKKATSNMPALTGTTIEELSNIITEEQISKAWGNANFGSVSKHEVILETLKKVAQGWGTGHTAMCIVQELGLVEKRNQSVGLSDKGLDYLLISAKCQADDCQSTVKGIKSIQQIIEERNFFCDEESIEIIESMMQEAQDQVKHQYPDAAAELRYIEKLLPLAQKEVDAVIKFIGYEPPVLSRLLNKLSRLSVLSNPLQKFIAEFNARQASMEVHPFTCDRHHKNCEANSEPRDYSKDGVLIATEHGLICPCGNYSQPLPQNLADLKNGDNQQP